jgi:ABC-2 type transport system ATP-binding protein
MSDAIVLQGVKKSFGAKVAVDDLTLSVPRGSIYGFIGPNGSGKSTTIRMIMNIIFPDQGEIEVLGERTSRAARDRVSYLPEERSLYKKMTVKRALVYFGALKGVESRLLGKRADVWLERMGLTDYAHKKIETLSKGMSQKVQFIAAAISEPELLILDEPFSGLDPVNGEVVRQAILDQQEAGTTIVFSTHDMGMAERMCDRVFMIFRGKKVLDGSLEEIQTTHAEPVVRVRSSLSADQLRALPGAASVVDHGKEQEIRLVDGAEPDALLAALAAAGKVQKFELGRPSLHDIFVGIAKPGHADREE